jgi:hypothetical protein
VFKTFGVCAFALILAACVAHKARHAGPQNPNEPVWPMHQQLPGRIYQVDAGQSELRVLVYRAGPLARFGHNHVVVNRALRGAVNLAEQPGASGFWLSVPVDGFVVDDAQARREEGPDFAAEVPDDARSGTLQNMLGTALLDAAEFPVISVNSVSVSDPPGAPGSGPLIATVAISVAGRESRIEVPVNLQSDSGRLDATGSLDLRQSALGLTPYSLMLGALQVQDAMTIKFKIVAVPI